MDFKCKCGHNMFNVTSNGKFARCAKCGTIYDDVGEEVEIENPLSNYGEVAFMKHFLHKCLNPK